MTGTFKSSILGGVVCSFVAILLLFAFGSKGFRRVFMIFFKLQMYSLTILAFLVLAACVGSVFGNQSPAMVTSFAVVSIALILVPYIGLQIFEGIPSGGAMEVFLESSDSKKAGVHLEPKEISEGEEVKSDGTKEER